MPSVFSMNFPVARANNAFRGNWRKRRRRCACHVTWPCRRDNKHSPEPAGKNGRDGKKKKTFFNGGSKCTAAAQSQRRAQSGVVEARNSSRLHLFCCDTIARNAIWRVFLGWTFSSNKWRNLVYPSRLTGVHVFVR